MYVNNKFMHYTTIGIKWHMALHVPTMIEQYGVPKLFDMIHFEHGHKKKVKDPFRRTSGRLGDIDNEIMRKIEIKTIITDVRDIYRRNFHRKDIMKLEKARIHNSLFYTTEEGIINMHYIYKIMYVICIFMYFRCSI